MASFIQAENSSGTHFDLVVIGGGPAGQKAAVQGAKSKKRVLLIDASGSLGGACVHRGTIPSKTLRETAMAFQHLARKSGKQSGTKRIEGARLDALMKRKTQVIEAHERYMGKQLERNGVTVWQGRAKFVAPHEVSVTGIGGAKQKASGDFLVIATGSIPRNPPRIPIDHEHVLDSDSLLSLTYLPHSLAVLGAGVIASEYASIFAALGSNVTMIDRKRHPVSFLDEDIRTRFVQSFEELGGKFVGGTQIESVVWDGFAKVTTTLESGEEIRTEKVLCALGRVANIERLCLENAKLAPNGRGLIDVDKNLQTSQEHIYAVGDVIGAPALASTSMEQGRRAACHAFGLPLRVPVDATPSGVYTIPEIGSVGLDEQTARKQGIPVVVGRAPFSEIARGHIAATEDGFLKLIADKESERIVGVQAIGEGAAELIHIGQMALIAGLPYQTFIDATFNFPTLAEAYRVAALAIGGQLRD